ncbi:hypothetical protein [Micromonospora aurantiaca (nom. illeg.)]|uniref:hypothetical protein n=1 Tax=Micromonospora aurantiaca (nom. illeg.) TaxID=47850 RepID=UPI003652BD93
MARKLSAFDVAVANAARAAVGSVQPAELPLLEDILNPPREYFRWRRSDVIGFGVEDAVHWASPYAVAAALWYGRIWFDEGKSIIEERTRGYIRRLTDRQKVEVSSPRRPAPSQRPSEAEHGEHVRLVYQYVVSLGMDDGRAELLAQAIVEAILRIEEKPTGDG